MWTSKTNFRIKIKYKQSKVYNSKINECIKILLDDLSSNKINLLYN